MSAATLDVASAPAAQPTKESQEKPWVQVWSDLYDLLQISALFLINNISKK